MMHRLPMGPLFQTVGDPAAPGGGSGTFRGCTCDFCNCTLAADGGVLKMSPRARELAKIEDKIERLELDLAAAKAAAAAAETQLTAARADLARRPVPARDDDDDDD